MIFSNFITRINDQTLQELLGSSVIKLLLSLDSKLASPDQLRKILLGLYSPATLLTSRITRPKLLEYLRENEAKILCQLLNIPIGENVFNALENASITKNSKREKALLDFFEIVLPIKEPIENTPETNTVEAAYALFPHQRKAVRKVQEKLNTGKRRVILHMPTGSGKTRTAMNVIAEHFRKTEPGVVIWLAQSEELCEQAAMEFEKAWSYLGNRSLKVHRFWKHRKINIDEVNDGFIIAGLAKLYQSVKSNQNIVINLGSKAKLIVVDEAHSSVADTYEFLLNAMLSMNLGAMLLGLTATPGRTWNNINEDLELAKFFGKQKVTLEVDGYDSPVDYLISENYLAKPLFKNLMNEGGLKLSSEDLEKIKENFEITDEVLKRLADDEKRNLKIISAVEELALNHKRILVFAATVKHSNLLSVVLQARGFNAKSITSDTPDFDRTKFIEDYKNRDDQVRILCNYGVLTTGFDAPQTSAAVIARPTESLVLYSQMVGRAIRGTKAGGNKEAEIVTVIDNELPGFGSISDSFNNWEDVWTQK
jgi:DNA repair protein RadD